MKRAYFLFILLIAAACSSSEKQPTLTKAILPTLPPESLPAPPGISPENAHPAPNILISYYEGGKEGWPDWSEDCLKWTWRPQFVVYADGHLVRYQKDGLWEKFLKPQALDDLLQKITDTGFFQIPNGFDENGRDLIYQTPYPHVGEGGPSINITIKGKSISIYEPLSDYTIEPVKKVEQIINNVPMDQMQPYLPERLHFEVSDAANLDLKDMHSAEAARPDPSVIPWPIRSPSLADLANAHEIINFRRSEVQPVMPFFPKLPMARLFSQNNRQYLVIACPALPNE